MPPLLAAIQEEVAAAGALASTAPPVEEVSIEVAAAPEEASFETPIAAKRSGGGRIRFPVWPLGEQDSPGRARASCASFSRRGCSLTAGGGGRAAAREHAR